MKEKIENNQKKPWYVRISDWLEGRQKTITRTMIILAVAVYILGSAISYGVLTNRPMTPYEEAYDIEFKNYVNEKLEGVADEVVNQITGINHESLQKSALEYNIKYTGQGIIFSYLLDKDKTISEYYSETGKKPFFSYSSTEQEFKMEIQLSNDFEIISKEASLEIPENREKYEQLYPRRTLVNATMLYGPTTLIVLLAFYLVVLMFLMLPAEAFAEGWRKKHERNSN